MNAILEQVINVVFMFFGNKLKGYRTKIIATVTAILGAWAILANVFPDICTNFHLLCNINNTKFYGIAMVAIGALNYALKKLDQAEALKG